MEKNGDLPVALAAKKLQDLKDNVKNSSLANGNIHYGTSNALFKTSARLQQQQVKDTI